MWRSGRPAMAWRTPKNQNKQSSEINQARPMKPKV
jgi:hypothetical protein